MRCKTAATVHAQQKWEYMEVTRKTERFLLNDLNDAGQHGWELVSTAHGKDRSGEDRWTGFLKRPYIAHGAAHDSKADAVHAPPEQNVIQPPKQTIETTGH